MITDWNSPQGDFDPTEKQGELLMLLSGQQVTVHTSAEDDFDYILTIWKTRMSLLW